MTVLMLTDRSDLAADLIVLELRRRGVRYWRLNLDDFPAELQIAYDPANSSATFLAGGEQLDSPEVGVAWYRRQRQSAHQDPYVRREAQVFLQWLWREMTWPWVNDPAAVDRVTSKLWQLRVASEIGLAVPGTLAGNAAGPVVDRFTPGPVIAKTLGGAAIDRDGIRHHLFSQLVALAELDPAATAAAPCLFQESVKPGTDVRVTVVGEQVFATDIVAPAGYVDWREAPPQTVTYCPADLPAEIAKRCLELCRMAALTYAAFDFVRRPSGSYVFLEVNPSGQWGWLERATGQPITRAIVDVLVSHMGGNSAGKPARAGRPDATR